jgi:hypothetical protein
MDESRAVEDRAARRYRGPDLRSFLRQLPSALGTRGHFCVAARGYQYAELPPDLLRRVPGWLRSGTVQDGEEIRAGRVYRWRDFLIKLYGPGHPLKDRLRPSSALRSAELYRRLLPLRTPRPVLAIEVRRLGGLQAALLVSELIEGGSLYELWRDDDPGLESALRTLPSFLAAMHRARVRHGDLHPRNLMWDGREWVLVDLDGMRRRQRIRRRIIERQWAQLVVGLRGDERLRACFAEYVALAHTSLDEEGAWRRINAEAEASWEAMRKLGWVEGAMRHN